MPGEPTIPNHPSSAELAAFRIWWAGRIGFDALPDSLRTAFVPTGAMPDECSDGIGYHDDERYPTTRGWMHDLGWDWPTHARREAGAMRSQRFVGPEVAWPALDTFAPRSAAQRRLALA